MKKIAKVVSLALLMVAVCSTTVAALPSSATKTIPGRGTVEVTISRSPEYKTRVVCTNSSSGMIELESFITKYYDKERPSVILTDYQTGSAIPEIDKYFMVPSGRYAYYTKVTVSVDALEFHESVEK